MSYPLPSDDDDRDLPETTSTSNIRALSPAPRYYEVRRQSDRGWVVSARFRLMSDAMRHVSQHREEGPFEVLDPDGAVAAKVMAPPVRKRRSAPTIPSMRKFTEDDT